MTEPRALRVGADEFRAQRRCLNSLPGADLARWIRQCDVLAAWVQVRLAQHPHKRVRAALAEHAHLLPRTIGMLEQDASYNVRRTLSCRTDLPRGTYTVLLARADSFIRANLARATWLERTDMELLASAHCTRTWAALCRHPALPLDMFKNLAPRTRATAYAASSNPLLDGDLLDEFVRSSEPLMRTAAARTGRLDLTQATIVLDSADAESRTALLARAPRNEEIIELVLARAQHAELKSLTHHPGLTDQELTDIADIDLLAAAGTLARRRTTSTELLLRVADQHLASVADVLVHRADLPLSVLSRLHAGDEGTQVQESAAAHPALSREQMEESFHRGGNHTVRLAANPSLPQDLQRRLSHLDLDRLAGTAGTFLLPALARNPALEADSTFSVALLREADSSLLARARSSTHAPTWDTLVGAWEGSLDALVRTVDLLGPG